MTDAITDCKPSCNIYGSREWNGIWGAVGVGRGEGGNIKIFSSNFHDLHKSSCRPQGGGPDPRTPWPAIRRCSRYDKVSDVSANPNRSPEYDLGLC